MMKIHTTQNLTTLGTTIQPTNVVSQKDFRLNLKDQENGKQTYFTTPSFHGKKPDKNTLNKFTKKVVEEAKKIVGDIQKNPGDDKKFGDGILKSKWFNKILSISEHEPLVQAIISFVVCMIFRPLTIMGISNDKSRQDNAYAAAHAMASGATGLALAFIITNPFKKGEKYAMDKLLHTFKESVLKQMYPHLDLASINDNNGVRKLTTEWLDTSGNKFVRGMKDVSKVAKFKSFADISEATYKTLGADVDWAAMKGKSFNDVITKDGKSLYDVLDWTKVGIKVNDKGSSKPLSILCKNLDRNFLSELIKDAEEGSNWKKLDISSVYGKDGLVKDFREWKDVAGKQWKLDLDSSYISSAMETADYIPEISGKIRRVSTKSEENKYTCYLKNGKNNRLGTEITQAMHDADASTEVQKKFITWLPDILSRIPQAIVTVALISKMLKILHIEKAPKSNQQKNIVNDDVKENESMATQQQAFKGKEDPSFFKRIFNKLYGELYGKHMYEWEGLRNISEKSCQKLGGIDNMSKHFQVAGSAITSGTYMVRTLNNDDLDKDRRKTLAINQFLCFVIPTAGAYTVDRLLHGITKKIEYRYSGLMEQKIAQLRATGNPADLEKVEKITKNLSRNLRGIGIISGLLTFTLIYRYLTPVLVTPVANKTPEWWHQIKEYFQKRNADKSAQQDIPQNVHLATT